MLPIIFILPFVQLLILSNAASFEVKNIKFSYIDHDHSTASRELISKFQSSDYFKIIDHFESRESQSTDGKGR
jgi:ABC-2 type transport system permease protein